MSEPSPWVARFAPLVAAGAPVLDLAAGRGRHTSFFLERGHPVVAVDRDVTGLGPLIAHPGLEAVAADLEHGPGWPLPERRFGAVVAVNYLWRPLFADLLDALAPGGVLLYETFMSGQERFGRPANPDFLLQPDELLDRVRGRLAIVAFEQGVLSTARGPAVRQRICARFAPGPADLPG